MVQQGLVVGTLLRAKPRRQTTQQKPFLFDLPLFRKLLELVEGMPDNPRVKMRRQTYRMLFVLLYGLGLRVGESCRLCCKDVDLIRRLLIIRKTKFAKDRLIPFGPRIGAALRNYLEVREKTYGPLSPESPVFCFTKDRPINPDTITLTFHQLILRLKLVAPPGHASPHLHHLRHSFAVGTLLRWYRTGIDPQTRLIQLSTFLGHANPASSAVYLTITDNLLVEANKRFEQFARVALEIEE
jgi:integrase